MEMSNYEIASRYRRAGKTAAIIQILAELNCCFQSDIKEILIQEGEMEAPKKVGRRKKEDAAVPGKGPKTIPVEEEKIIVKPQCVHQAEMEKREKLLPVEVKLAVADKLNMIANQIDNIRSNMKELEETKKQMDREIKVLLDHQNTLVEWLAKEDADE